MKLAVLEERMKTMHVEYKTDIARLAEDGALREKQQLLVIAGIID